MSRWLRINEDCIDNPKILKLPEALRWQWVALLCVASKNDGVLPPIDDIALCLRVPEAKAAEFITKLVKANLIDRDGEHFVPHNWDKRQYKTDATDPTNAKRQKRYRDRHRNDSNAVTDNVSNDVTVKRPEAEAKPETESEQSRADAGAPIDEDLKRKASALAAGVSGHFLGRGQPIPNLDRCLHWLAQGYAVGTVLTAVETVLKRGKPISTLEYFDGAIRDAHARVPLQAAEQITSGQFRVFVSIGTPEWNAWQSVSGPRGTPTREKRDADGRVQTGWDFPKLWPDGFDEASRRETGSGIRGECGVSAKAPDFGFIYDLRRGIYVNGASLCPCCGADDGYDKCEYCGGKGWLPEEWDDDANEG